MVLEAPPREPMTGIESGLEAAFVGAVEETVLAERVSQGISRLRAKAQVEVTPPAFGKAEFFRLAAQFPCGVLH